MSKDTAPSQWILGMHSVQAALRHGGSAVDEVWVEERRHDRRIREVLELAHEHGVRVVQVPKERLERIAEGVNHQGVAARTRAPSARTEEDLQALIDGLKVPALLLVLDGVTDPHNLGACLRSADAAGVHAVIAPKDRAAGLTPTACKVASGAAESIPFIQVTNLARTLSWLKEECWMRVIGTAGEADALVYEADLTGPLVIVMGAEEKGMRRLTREACDQLVKLPMLGRVESLNVSVATGVTLFEAVRQRGLPGRSGEVRRQ